MTGPLDPTPDAPAGAAPGQGPAPATRLARSFAAIGGALERPWVVPLATGLVALAVRVAYTMDIRALPLFDSPIMDAAIHDRWARGSLDLLHRGVPYFRAPLYVWFLQLVYALHPGYLLPRLVQGLLSAVTVGLVADCGRRLSGASAGLVGGLLLALCWPVVYFSGELLIVTLAVFLDICGLWLLVRAGGEDRPWLAAAGAAVVGISAIARPTVLVFLPVLVALPLWLWPRLQLQELGRRRWRRAGLLLLLALLPGLVLTVRNRIVGHDWVFIASQGGVNFYIGNNPQSDGRTAVVPGTRASWLGGYEDTQALAQREEGRPLRPSEVSRFYYRKGLRYWFEQPGDALRLYARKLRLLLGAGERSNNKNLHFWRARSRVLRLPFYVSWATLLALGVVGIALCRRRRVAAPLWGFLATYALGILLFFVNERYRVPLEATLAVFAGIPVQAAMAALRQHRLRRAAAVAVAVVAVLVATRLDRIGFREGRIDADAFSRATLGNAWLRKRQPARAVEAYTDALRVADRFHLKGFEGVEAQVRANLVLALLDLGDVDSAEAQLSALAQGRQGDPGVARLWGDVYRRREQFGRALPYYRRAVAAQPDNEEALVGLGICQLHNNAYVTAQSTFRRALALAPDDPEALTGLAMAVLHVSENLGRSEELLERALALDPDIADAHQYLAEIRRRKGDFEGMVEHLLEALRIDPSREALARRLRRMGIDPGAGASGQPQRRGQRGSPR